MIIIPHNSGGNTKERIDVFKDGLLTEGYSIEPNISGGGIAVYDSSTKTWKCSLTGNSNPVPRTGIKISGLKENDFVFVKLKNVNLPKAQYSYFDYGSLTYTVSSFPDNTIVKDIMYIADTIDNRNTFTILAQYWANGVRASFEVEEIWIEKINN